MEKLAARRKSDAYKKGKSMKKEEESATKEGGGSSGEGSVILEEDENMAMDADNATKDSISIGSSADDDDLGKCENI